MPRSEARAFIIIPFTLLAMGLVELSSISQFYFERQLAWAFFSVSVFALFALVSLKFWKALGIPLYLASLLFLALALAIGGPGPRRWLQFGSTRFQPSELAKLGYILVAARILSNRRKSQIALLLQLGFLALIPFLLTIAEPDLATSVTFLWIYVVLLFLFDISPFYLAFLLMPPLAVITSFSPILFLLLFVGALLYSRYIKAGLAYTVSLLTLILFLGFSTPLIWKKALKPYQRERVIAFLAPEKYRTGSGWQILQARIALGSGGLRGKGYGRGTQKGLSFLPAAHTDFIFSSFGEEFGFVGSFLVFILFSGLIYTILRSSFKMRDRFRRALGIGIGAYFTYHFLANIGTNLGFFPVAGVPLPFMTYGGSHLTVEAALLGLLIRALREESSSYRILE